MVPNSQRAIILFKTAGAFTLPMPERQGRQPALICTLQELIEGPYVVKEGWVPNYVATRRGHVSRANVIGVIVESDGQTFTIDDGTGRLPLRTFDEKRAMVGIGDAVLVICRPREYAGSRFLNYEIIKKVKPGWLAYRKRELELFLAGAPSEPPPEAKRPMIEQAILTPVENPFAKLLEAIRALDTESNGAGAATDAILERANVPDGERLLNTMLEEGELFELKHGRIKILE